MKTVVEAFSKKAKEIMSAPEILMGKLQSLNPQNGFGTVFCGCKIVYIDIRRKGVPVADKKISGEIFLKNSPHLGDVEIGDQIILARSKGSIYARIWSLKTDLTDVLRDIKGGAEFQARVAAEAEKAEAKRIRAEGGLVVVVETRTNRATREVEEGYPLERRYSLRQVLRAGPTRFAVVNSRKTVTTKEIFRLSNRGRKIPVEIDWATGTCRDAQKEEATAA